ncbi:MAG: type VI secretion system baseplate subunit TssE, partial [Polyangiaceae bacterium]|nr:type VI secretion system baseplate subunit TssE [Polyangiaceae bacterium]
RRYPDAARSVLNYGLPDFTGHTTSSIDVPVLERLLRTAIWDFEPRLIPNSVRVRLNVDAAEMSRNAMTFSIEAELWAHPIPLRLFFRTDIDLDSGEVVVTELKKSEAT